jgi:superfamily I DNA and RNA helicase
MRQLEIVRGTSKKPVSSDQIEKFLRNLSNEEGWAYIGYPIIGTSKGPFALDVFWISKKYGVVIINLVESDNVQNYGEAQDDCVNKVDSKLRSHPELVEKRRLKVPVTVGTFALRANLQNISDCKEYPIFNTQEGFQGFIDNITTWNEKDSECYPSLISIVQSISTIRKGQKKRQLKEPDSKGAKLKTLEDSIAALDSRQAKAVIENVEGVQRIRGLAGSGKTIVLALKAAYLHSQHPDWKIAVTFHTRSLKEQFKQLITTFCISQTNEEPDWENLHILHSWGSPGGGDKNGLYYSFCEKNNAPYFHFGIAKEKYGTDKAFSQVCLEALSHSSEDTGFYDSILVDEAQDFSPEFLKLCYTFLKQPKRLVYAYDELQNLSSESLPSPEVIFGKNANGVPKVKLENISQDVILEVCYRNSRPVLTTAHALGFGLYRKKDENTNTGIVQIFEENSLWTEVGYKVSSGELTNGKDVVLSRTDDSSPKFLEDHSPIDDLVQFQSFKSREEQDSWVVNEIMRNLSNEELRTDDIIVINPDPLTTKNKVTDIRKMLFDNKINSHLAGVDSSLDSFFDANNESITFTGIYRAKGNEAGMVYIINAQDCYSSYNLARARNRLFTAITRSKAWVRVVGFGKAMDELVKEYEQVKSNDFTLSFTYPTEEQKKSINIVHRDMDKSTLNTKIKLNKNLMDLLQLVESGNLYIEDLDPLVLRKLSPLIRDIE